MLITMPETPLVPLPSLAPAILAVTRHCIPRVSSRLVSLQPLFKRRRRALHACSWL